MSYTPPAGNAVDLSLTGAYTPPLGNAVALILTDTGISAIAGTAATGQGSQTDSAIAEYLLTGTAATGQGNQTDSATGESASTEFPLLLPGRRPQYCRVIPPGSGQGNQTTAGSGTVTAKKSLTDPAWLARLRAEDELLLLML